MTIDIRLETALESVMQSCGEAVYDKIRQHMNRQMNEIERLEKEVDYLEQASIRHNRRRRREEDWE